MADILHSVQSGQNINDSAQTFIGAKTFSTGIVGATNGAAIAAGYIGEKIAATTTNTAQGSPVLATWYDITAGSITITAGVWLVYWCGLVDLTGATTSSASSPIVGSLAVREASTVIQSIIGVVSQGVLSSVRIGGQACGSMVVTTSSSKTYKLSMQIDAYTGSGQSATQIAAGAPLLCQFYAVRIA
jgi:hypothetical protein